MFVVNFLTSFSSFPNWKFLVSNWEKKRYFLALGMGVEFRPQIKQKRNTVNILTFLADYYVILRLPTIFSKRFGVIFNLF